MLGKARLDWVRGRGALEAAACAVVLLGLAAAPAEAVQKDLTAKGEVLVKENCSRCHAIGKDGDSPHPEAPPFRTLSSKYPVEDLAESLAEGIVSGHPDMPIFAFNPHDVAAIIEYLESIQIQQPTPPDEEPD
jgi:cytochrome c